MIMKLVCSAAAVRAAGLVSGGCRCRACRVGRIAVPEELEDLHLSGREFGVEGLHEDAVVVKLVAADGAEDLQDPFGRRGGAVPELGVEPDLGEVGPLHAGADLAFELTRRMSDARPVPTSDRSCSRWPAPHRRRTRPPAAASG